MPGNYIGHLWRRCEEVFMAMPKLRIMLNTEACMLPCTAFHGMCDALMQAGRQAAGGADAALHHVLLMHDVACHHAGSSSCGINHTVYCSP